MTLTDVIIIVAVLAVVGGAVAYIIKAKKSGKKCIGCPDGASCSACAHCNACSGGSCSCDKDSKKEEK